MAVIIYGKKIDSQLIGDRTAFCGGCLETTAQELRALLQRSHVYFVSFGAGVDVGRIAVCEECGSVVPVLPRTRGTKAQGMVDAFLDAHQLPLEHAHKSVWIGLAAWGLMGLGIFLFIGMWQLLSGYALLASGVAIAVLTGVAYHFAKRRIGDWRFARRSAPTLTKLLGLTSWTVQKVADRAARHGYRPLSRYLSSTASASSAQGPAEK